MMGILSSLEKLGVKLISKLSPKAPKGLTMLESQLDFPRPTTSQINVLTGKVSTFSKVKNEVSTGLASGLGKVTSYAVANPTKAVLGATKGTLAVAGIGGVLAGGGLDLVPEVFKATKKATQTTVGLITGEKKFSTDDLKDIGRTAGAVVGLGAVGAGAGYLIDQALDKAKDKKEDIDKVLDTNPYTTSPPSDKPESLSSVVPISPETQVVPTEAGTVKRRKRKKTKSVSMPSNNIRVNVINNSRLQTGKKLINNISYR